jgi:hypothetical protein
MDKHARRLIDEAIDGFAAGLDGKHYRDLESAAVYRIEPPGSECIALACLACHTVTIRPGAPRLARLSMACNNCGQLWPLRPPADVLAFGALGLMVVTGPGARADH